MDGALTKELSGFANYSYQPTPRALDFSQSEINLPPKNRLNVGANYSGNRLVREPRHQLSGRGLLAGRARRALFRVHRRLHAGERHRRREARETQARDQYMLALKIVNLFNEDIQQHIFGDIFKRQVSGELRVSF